MRALLRALFSTLLLCSLAAPLDAQRRSDILNALAIDSVMTKGATAFEAVQTLRPRWLTTHEPYLTGRPGESIQSAGAHVYINDIDQGDVEYLRSIPAELVLEMRWLSANQAASRFGPTNGPAIVVTLKRP